MPQLRKMEAMHIDAQWLNKGKKNEDSPSSTLRVGSLLHCLFAFTCIVGPRSDASYCSRTRAMSISYNKALFSLGITATLWRALGRQYGVTRVIYIEPEREI